MIHTADKKDTLRDRVITTKPTERVERLRQKYLDTGNRAVIDIGRIVTRVTKETEG